jgi:hypothetical protein
MKPTIKHLCGCRDAETKKAYAYGQCPQLARRGHGYHEWRVWVPKERQALVGKRELKGGREGDRVYPRRPARRRNADRRRPPRRVARGQAPTAAVWPSQL